MTQLSDHSKISFTAKIVALARGHSDIPFADDVLKFVGVTEALAAESAELVDIDHSYSWFAPMMEARYKSLCQAVLRSKVKQVVEFASGLSLRGLAMTQSHPELTYLETDLPDLNREKMSLLESIKESRGQSRTASHHVLSANILVWDELEKVLAYLDPKEPVAVIHEGLFMYLSKTEKEQAGRHIHRILSRFGGVWMTPDFAPIKQDTWDKVGRDNFLSMLENIEKRTGRSFVDHSFDDQNEINAFCDRLGFDCTVLPQLDGSFQLTSAGPQGLSPQEVEIWTKLLPIYEMRVKKTQT